MHNLELEAWALRVLERIRKSEPVEDARVELKSTWIEPAKAARLIAGQANALRGEDFIWMVGVDEKKGVVGCPQQELANWLPQVHACFDGIPPRAMAHIVLDSVSGNSFMILHFSPNHLPYVVKVPATNEPQLSVPWREGTRIRNARHGELVLLLAEIGKPLDIDPMSVYVHAEPALVKGAPVKWKISGEVYVIPPDTERVVIPFHRCSASLTGEGGIELSFPFQFNIEYSPFSFSPGKLHQNEPRKPLTATAMAMKNEVILDGPSKLLFGGRIEGGPVDALPSTITLRLAIYNVRRRAMDIAEFPCRSRPTTQNHWSFPGLGIPDGTDF